MEKQEIKSKWDDLARELGAELSPDAEHRAEIHTVASESGGKHETESPPAPRTPLPKKPAADWAGLAGELGLPPLEEESIPVEKPLAKSSSRDAEREQRTAESHSREAHARDSQHREESRGETRPSRGRRRGRGGGQQRDRRDDQRGRGASGEHRGERPGPRRDRGEGRPEEKQRGQSDKRRDRREPPRESAGHADFDTETSHEPLHEQPPLAEESSPTPQREPPAKTPAVSLWHKIFGAPAEPAANSPDRYADDASAIDETPDERETQSDFGGEIRSLSGEDVTAAGFVEERTDPLGTEDQGENAERTRGRSRRRRRGGRGRKSSGRQREGRTADPRIHEQGGDDQLDADFDDLGDDMDSPTESERPVDGDTDLDDSDGELAPSQPRSMSAAQRAIPSWDDAIGFIVDSNMQGRSVRPRAARSDARGNSRGRSRGGRRK
jgi:hypothetical protein